MIPEAAVEAAAKSMLGADKYDGGWDALPQFIKIRYTRDARRILEAAAPHMLAEAWSTCAVESARRGLLSATDALMLANRNPCRSAE